MGGVILIPWREGAPERKRNLDFTVAWYGPLELPVFYGDSDPDQPFNRAAARNAAAAAAGDWDVAAFIDADCVADLDTVQRAIDMARENQKAYIPHTAFWSLPERGTNRLMTDPKLAETRGGILKLMGQPNIADSVMPSGVVVVPRVAFDAIGGYEEGFIGWGWEDTAFLFDLRRTGYMGKPERVHGNMLHLWHPRGGLRIDREARPHNAALAALHPVTAEVN